MLDKNDEGKTGSQKGKADNFGWLATLRMNAPILRIVIVSLQCLIAAFLNAQYCRKNCAYMTVLSLRNITHNFDGFPWNQYKLWVTSSP